MDVIETVSALFLLIFVVWLFSAPHHGGHRPPKRDIHPHQPPPMPSDADRSARPRKSGCLMANDDFKVMQFNDGQVYIHDRDNVPLLHAQIKGPHNAVIQVHTEARIEIDKMYGPLIFMPIRVKLDFEACEWVIERGDGGDRWREVARIPGQIEGDFHEPRMVLGVTHVMVDNEWVEVR